MEDLEFTDIQRLLLRAYKNRPIAAYMLFRITDPEQAAMRLREQLHLVQNAAGRDDLAQGVALSVAFTNSGMEKLTDKEVLESFTPEFRQGMTAPHRARALGDVGDNAHTGWRWGKQGKEVDLLCAAFAAQGGQAALDSLCVDLQHGDGIELVWRVDAELNELESFGFQDGKSQPTIAGCGGPVEQLSWNNIVQPGEFLLGYPNELGTRSASPSVAPKGDERYSSLPRLPDRPRYDLGRNGSFLVVRELEQLVTKFPKEASKAAEIIGRRKDGSSLVHPSPRTYGPERSLNDFSYHAEDRHGLRCPLGAHVRRANPRDALADDALGITPERANELANQHRLLRRSRSFARRGQNPESVGLFFMCFNTNLERQFEFVQQTWLNNPKFGGLKGDKADPLLDFVRVRGGAYFFLPGIKALRCIIGDGPRASRPSMIKQRSEPLRSVQGSPKT